ncbi:7-carboxy-7-deazaguanine synthase QueE [Ketobacter sp. MCCC 1A13808]|nr:7-carboxy-7-deazaguanine synthase QueE [Ketobacter sp. MCCC 1A13808]MVF10743.1 7-carboxy-7-deazaguanine synthase QueE [Ketobacter sp. MCCC 1A13808]RLP56159.1 MAG: 7-carboxy-7-deazaguanine synthase QueE [Ketobacter sp.]
MSVSQLRITEIFYSLQGEARTIGLPTVFVRLTGCPLRCQYCDTEYAFSGGEMRSLQQILDQVNSYSPRYVTVTGGEPLAQPNCIPLLSQLCDLGLEVSLETSGALDVSEVDSRVSIVLDLKTPGSGEMHRNLYSNLEHLKPKDQIKFVICGRQDYQWAKMQLSQLKLDLLVGDVLFSPSHQAIEPADLANWIVEDNLPVRFQLQLHKILWADQPGY